MSAEAQFNMHVANISAHENVPRAKAQQPRKSIRPAQRSLWVIGCSYVVAVFVVYILFMLLWRKVFPIRERFQFDRVCVHLDRHAVRPRVPAIDSAPGGHMEPYAIGWLAFDRRNNEVTWDIEDSLGIEPHNLLVRGPLTPDRSDVAPVFISLGVQRNARFHLEGAAHVSADKIDAIEEQISRAERRQPGADQFYISMTEQLADGSIRELVRGRLNRRCVRGVE